MSRVLVVDDEPQILRTLDIDPDRPRRLGAEPGMGYRFQPQDANQR